MSGEAIDLDAIDIDEIEPEKKRRRHADLESKKHKEVPKEDEEFEKRIRERMQRLRDKSLSPDRRGDAPRPRERDAQEARDKGASERRSATPPPPPAARPSELFDKDDFEESTPNDCDLSKTSLCSSKQDEAAYEALKKSGKPMTKIQIQLEKARLHKERAMKQAQEDAKINPKKKFGARSREYTMMRSTMTHWSDKKLSKMNERDWRIFREDFEIQVLGSGATCPLPMRNWEEGYREGLLSPKIMEAIKSAGYRDPSPVQMACIPVGIKRLDLIGLAETGSGKTCAFVIPLVTYVSEQPPMTDERREHGPYAVIMCPSRELARQIEDECYRFTGPFGFNTVSVVGGVKHEQQGHEIRKGVEIVVGTPGRLCDLVERHYLVFNQCNYVVLDEADSMVKEGMEEQVVKVFEAMPSSNVKPADADDEEAGKTYRVTVMYSSTMAPELEHIAKKHLRRPVIIKVGLSSPSDIKQTVVMMEEAKEKRPCCLQMIKDALNSPGAPLLMVFCNQRKEVEALSAFLEEEGVPVCYTHGGLSQGEREQAIEGFHSRKHLVLVATDILGRGIDVKGVTHVLNYDCPVGDNAIDKYSQRIGRTGRQGMKGEAITFLLTKTDTEIMYDLKKKLETEGQTVPKSLAMQEAAKYPPGQLATRRKRETVIHTKTY
eukprot:TRINITY_DN14253_c0_g1_i1.p1 TRINITY_DN14253_c0_g1~~TRINITY_DN14253_c0_g1_i1.p1  ORF type:complete len:670 (+),score=220.96 TRINITY_DN14253_c0_g1_i1:29-2011(+)